MFKPKRVKAAKIVADALPFLVALAIAPTIAMLFPTPAIAQPQIAPSEVETGSKPGAILFNKSCVKCHPVGQAGDISFTRSWPAAQLEEAILRMEPQVGPLEPEQVLDLIALIQDPQMADRLETAKQQNPHGAAGNGTSAEGESEASTLESSASKWMISSASIPAPSGGSTGHAGTGSPSAEDIGAMTFAKSCAGCHAIGGSSNLSAPNLASTLTWPAADLEAAVIRMEKFAGPMSQEQVQGLVSLLQDPEAANRLKKQQELKAQKQTASLEKPSAELGGQLFHGELAFANGGMACSACHAIGSVGGSMGPVLTDAFSRLGQSALQSACEQGNFKVMSAAYRDHKVTPQEALHLTEYLKRVDNGRPARPAGANVPLYGTAGAFALLASLGLLFRKRNGGSVRRKLMRRR